MTKRYIDSITKRKTMTQIQCVGNIVKQKILLQSEVQIDRQLCNWSSLMLLSRCRGASDVSLHVHISPQYTQTHSCTSQETRGQNKGLGVLTQILKAQLLDLEGLPNVISLFSPSLSPSLPFTLCLHSSLTPFIIHPALPSLFSSHAICVSLRLSFITHCLTIQ